MKGWRIGFFVAVGVGSIVAAWAGMALAVAGDDPRSPAVLMSPATLRAPSPWAISASPATPSTPAQASASLIGEMSPPDQAPQVVAAPSRPSFERWRRLPPYSVYRDPVTVYLLDE